MADMRGKRVLITGGARGIGLATAEHFAKAGAELILTDVDEAALKAAAAQLGNGSTKIHTRVIDVTSEKAVKSLAAWVEKDLGGLDVLVNNAGIGHHGELKDTHLKTWRKLIDVNLMGPIHHIDAFLPQLMERSGGQIVNVSSGQAFFRMPTWGAYAAIKAALAVMSEILHFELKKYGVHVTTVYPYMVNTGFYDDVKGETWAAKMSMKLLPYYSDSPEKVGRLIFEATRKRKRVEMINPINDVAFYGRVVPLFSQVVARSAAFFLAK
jgi:NAD(P)-dependent dehydrogenase (short-subunit alcohol dehydrogenase family)